MRQCVIKVKVITGRPGPYFCPVTQGLRVRVEYENQLFKCSNEEAVCISGR